MTAETALQVGRAVAFLFKRKGHRTKIVIGKDTRISGYMLEEAMVSGVCSMGGDAYLLGPLPTPGIAKMIQSQRADAGIVIVSKQSVTDVQVDAQSRAGNQVMQCLPARHIMQHGARLRFERGSQAAIILLQAESVELDRQARLVGNFGSEKELSTTLGRFGERLRGLAQAQAEERPVPLRKAEAAADPARGRRPPNGSS